MTETAQPVRRRRPEPPDTKEGRKTILVVFSMILVVIGYIGWRAYQHPYIIKAKFTYADGLKAGAEVQLAGVKVGNVQQIRFLSVPTNNPQGEVFEVVLSIDPKIHNHPAGELIRKDAVAVLISTGALGDRSINIDPGSPTAPMTVSGDYIGSRVEPTVAMVLDNSEASRNNFYRVREIIDANVKFIGEGHGTIGKYSLENNELDRNLKQLFDSTDELQRWLDHGNGSLGRFQRDKKLTESIDRLLDLSDKLRKNIEQGRGSAGKFLQDPDFRARIERLQKRANELSARFDRIYDRVEHGQGNVAQLLNNPKLQREVKDLRAHIDKFSQLTSQRQGTIGMLLYDNRLNENMDQISQESLRLFYDIGQKPTKYIKFTLF